MTTAVLRRPLCHYLAAAGGLFLVWEAWTLTAWLTDGPRMITEFRDRTSPTWWIARSLEGAVIVLAVVMTALLVRAHRNGRRVTFDVLFVVAASLAFWTDPLDNWIQPIWLYNSNFVNVSNWSGHMPFVLNPAADKVPEPILFGVLTYSFGILAFCMLMEAIARRLLVRRPDLTRGQLWLRLFAIGAVLDLALEVPLLATGMERQAAFPSWASIGGHSPAKFSLTELVGVALVFSGFAMLRLARDDRGLTLVERGWRPGPRATALTFLALFGVLNLGLFACNGALAATGLFADHYPQNPAYLLNGICGPATDYGPCPGTPGYQLKLKSTPRR